MKEENLSNEFIDAFVSLGGNPDRGGYVSKKHILEIIENEF